MPLIETFLADDATPATDLPQPLTAGADSAVQVLHVWNEQGNGAGQAAVNVLLMDVTESQVSANTYLRSGVQPQDERWHLARVVGYDNGGDPTWVPRTTDWTWLGAYGGLLVDRIPPDCALYVEVKVRPPGHAQQITWDWRLVASWDEYSQPMPPAIGRSSRGILHGVGDRSRTGLIRGGALTATGTPDDEVHVAAVLTLERGDHHGRILADHVLNQNDSAAAALAAGESYWAEISADGTVTKGVKAVAPTKPVKSALHVGYVEVHYDAGGTVIDPADIDTSGVVYDRYALVADGLNLNVHAGQAIAGQSWRYSSVVQPVAIPASEVRYLWQLDSGLFEISEEADEPPSDGALGPLAKVTTDISAITEIDDWRVYAGDLVVLRLEEALPGAAGAFTAALRVEHEELHVERVTVRVSDNGGGSSGETKFDVKLNGTTIYTGSATDDQRPVIAFDAAELAHDSGIPEVLILRRGDLVGWTTVTHPTGGTPARAELVVVCRRPSG